MVHLLPLPGSPDFAGSAMTPGGEITAPIDADRASELVKAAS